ncbi:MAG: autotransporter domain-containing protein, partial [Candidatus Omnitrophota bacterium]
GTTTVDAGTLYTNASNLPVSTLGNSNAIVVNDGGTIDCSATAGQTYDNSFVGSAANTATITINAGGVITDSFGHSNHLKALILDGGTLSETGGANAQYGNWNFDYGVTTPGNGNTSYITGGNATLGQTGGTVFDIGAGDTVNVSTVLALVTDMPDNGLIKQGSGTLTLSGANTYIAGTTLTDGTLNINNATALGGAAGTFTINGGAIDSTDAGGSVTMTNNNPITVNSDFAFTGTHSLTFAAGAVAFGSATRTITLNANNLTIGGVISGTGDTVGLATADGGGHAGKLTLHAVNTYTGATTIGANTTLALDASGTIATSSGVANAGTFTIAGNKTIQALTGAGGTTLGANTLTIGDANNRSCAYTGVIGGTGGIIKAGTGSLALSGASTYSGLTTINAGTLQVTNANAVGTGALTNNATLGVGTTSLSVTGVYTQNANSTLDLTANSSSSYGNIISAADAVVDAGSAVSVTVGGYLPNKATLKVIDGAGGAGVNVPGTIISSNSKYAFLGSSVDGDLILTVDRSATGFSSLSTNSNTSAAGAVLDDITNPSPDMLTVLDTLDSMSSASVGQSLDTVIPVADRSVVNTSESSLSQFISTITDRLEELFARSRNRETGVSAGSKAKKGYEAWGRGFGEYAHQKPRGLSNGYHATIWGTALGCDIPAFNDRVRLGMSGGYAASDINSKDNSGKTDIDSYQGTLYGGYSDAAKPYYLNGAFSFAFNQYKGSRQVVVGKILRIANSDYDGQQYSVLLDGGYTFKTGKLLLTPVASLQYLRLHLEGYTETGADALNLAVKSQNYDMLQSGLGMKLERPLEVACGSFIPEIHAKWLYDFIGDRQETTSTFSGGGGSFATQGFDPARNALDVGTKLAFVTKDSWSFEVNYDFEYKEDFASHTGWADIRYKF